MNTKNLLYLITALFFGILFYSQDAGLNYVLFTCMLLFVSAFMTNDIWKTKQWLTIAAGTFISSFFVMYYANGLTITMSIISVLILTIIQRSKNTSYLVALYSGIISILGSIIFIIGGNVSANRLQYLKKSQKIQQVKKWRPILIVVIVTFLFLTLYRSINPIFDAYFTDLFINISWGWIFFTILGAIISYTFFYRPRFLRKLLRSEQKHGITITEDSLKPNHPDDLKIFSSFESERYSAILMFVILNILLLLLNGTDIHYIFLKGELPHGITYSDYIHKGVGAIILSIIMAIALISFYFRGHINFDQKSKHIKALTYAWVVQNIVLIVMAAFKNHVYIEAYSLTLKRIGVYYYLAFSILGLLLTLYKIYYRKDTWFLFRSNSFGIYVVLILSCALNWNMIITKYNLKNSKQIDDYYLKSLGYENYPLLWDGKYYETSGQQRFELQLTGNIKHYNLPVEVGEFLKDYENAGMPSYCVFKDRTYQYFVQLAKSDKLNTK